MHRRTLNIGLLAAAGSTLLPVLARAAEVDMEKATAPRVLGDPNAPVLMIEYSSLTCPHCAAFHRDSYKQIVTEYVDTGKVRFEMRDFPLDQYALRAAAMARAVDGKRYFALIDAMFKQQGQWTRSQNPIDSLKKIGRLAGISPDVADAHMSNNELLDAILNARIVGQRTHNVDSTPTFVIGDEIVRGAQPFNNFKTVIDGQIA